MPLPSDERLLSLSNDVIKQFDTIFGLHPGFRPAHAKGLLLHGGFTPSPQAASLTRAPHAIRPLTPVLARFSDSTGLPMLPDNDPNANPRGLAIRFVLGDHVHTDIIGHSTDGFPTRTGEEFLELLRALASASTDPSAIQAFLGSHPAALVFVQTPKPAPSSFAREQYFGVTAMRFINAAGVSRYGRYRIIPEAGVDHLDEKAASGKDPNFLFDELSARVAKGPIEFGRVELTGIESANDQEQQQVIFDPIPRVDGIEPSADPLLELRAAVYLLSGRRRRQAPAAHGTTAG